MALVDRRLFGLLGFVAVGIAASSLPACSADDKSGLMLAISTDMRAPKDVNAVGITVTNNDTVKFSVIGRVTPDGEVLLPATLAIAEPDAPNVTVGIRVIAFQERKARVMRDVRTSIPKGGRIALLRIPLNFANDGSVVGELPDGILPTPATTKSLAGDTLFPRDNVDPNRYNPFAFVPNCPDPTQTWIAGQCADAFVPWPTLPTFTPGDVGRADDSATCFDVDGCYAGSTDIPETGDTGVTLDRSSCSLLLHGADPAQVNVALVTAATGECIKPGNCYVPLDHGAAGWTESDGRVQLPGYVCKLTPKDASLVLAPTTSKVCGAKTESRAFCASTTAADGGTSTTAGEIVSKEDFVSSIALEPGTRFLDSAGSTRVARIELTSKTGTDLSIPAGKKPWKVRSSRTGVLITDGTATGYAVTAGSDTLAVTLTNGGNDAAEVSGGGRLWVEGTPGTVVYSGPTDASTTTVGTSQLANTSTIVDMGNGRFVVGTPDGVAKACSFTSATNLDCPATAQLTAKSMVEDLAADPTSNGLGTWALTADGLYYLTSDGNTGLTAQVISGGSPAAVVDGVSLRYGVAAAGKCVVFTSLTGLQWLIRDAVDHAHGAFLVPHTPLSAPEILGVAVDATSIYYSVYAAADAGGGVYRVDIPAECLTH